MAFVISKEEAAQLLDEEARNAEVVKRFLDGDDLNTNPFFQSSRWVIDFKGRSLEECKGYLGPFKIVQERVYPVRMLTAEGRDEYERSWWQFWRPRSELYARIESLRETLVVTLHTKYLTPCFVTADQVFSHALGVFPTSDRALFGLMHSSPMDIWARLRSGSLGVTLRFTPTECLDTFPLPPNIDTLREIAAQYETFRNSLLRDWQIGLTELYNKFHDRAENSTELKQLRELQIELDSTVAAAYGWNNIELKHEFYQTKQGFRFTVDESARNELIDHLVALNHERYEEELRLHYKKNGSQKSSAAKRKLKKAAMQGELL